MDEKTHRETIQTLTALEKMDSIRKKNQQEEPLHHGWLYISPEHICELHSVLMEDSVQKPGQYRHNDAYPKGYHFMYSAPPLIPSHMFNWTDSLTDLVYDKDLSLEEIFKLAALVMFNFLDVHPFSDGNGRLARILASHILSVYHFFPVHTSTLSTSNKS